MLTAASLSNLDYADVMRSILGVERVVFYVNKERARRTHGLLRLFVVFVRQTSTAPSPLATTQNIPIRSNT